MTISPEQDGNGSELNKAFVVAQELVVSGGDAVKLLQLGEEAFHKVAFLVEGFVMRPLSFQLDLAGMIGSSPALRMPWCRWSASYLLSTITVCGLRPVINSWLQVALYG